MDTTTWLTIISTLLALGICVQVVALLGIWRSMRSMSIRVEALGKDLTRNINTISGEVGQAVTTIKTVAEGISAVSIKVAATAEIIHKRVGEVDSFIKEVTDSARLEVARIQDAIDTASRQIEETFALLQKGVLVPVKEVSAILRGFRVGLDFIFRRPKVPSNASPQDEEMFIG
jgi:methyl-accepting chemotaxis protein